MKEASEQWEVPLSTLKAALYGQKGYPPKFTEDECRKSAGTWLIKVEAMERLYGKRKK